MNTRVKALSYQVPRDGFSLIEVLVAVVVLSVGLIALAALQGNLVRGSSATRAQSQATALAQEKLEQMRGFTTTGGGSNSYAAIRPAVETINTVAGASGASTFTRTTTMARYELGGGTTCDIQNPAVFTFVKLSDSCAINDPIGLNEFKRVTVTVSSTNASGQTTSVQIGDVISVASPSDSIKTLAAQTASQVHPQVYIDPSKFAPGIIPIALGNSQSAAASDPQPETFSTGHITTRFSVQNYNSAPNSNGFVLLNKQFDFAATSCTCNLGSTSTNNSPAYSPTYWNGTKYITPTAIPSGSGSGKATGIEINASRRSSQDPILCSSCCRDHHDGAAQTDIDGNALKYDAFRPASETTSSDHNHYDTDSSNNLLTTKVTSGSEYYETCRLVRVDGINRVATDAREENHIVVAPVSPITITKEARNCDPIGASITTGTCYDHAVNSSTADNYASFVKDYVTAFYSAWQAAGSNYPLVPGSVRPGVGNLLVNSSGPSSIATTYASLVNPPAQTVLSINKNDLRYMEGRGIYIDYISPETKAALLCIGQTTNTDCAGYASQTVLQVLPFVAVNQTNLDSWTPPSTIINVTNAPIPTGGTFDPFIIGYTFDRGTTTGLASGTANAVVQARLGNAGLIDSLSVGPSYPFESYNCVQIASPFASQSPCTDDPPVSGYAYDTSTANGPRFQTDQQPYTVVAATPSNNVSFSVRTTDNTASGQPPKSNLNSPIAVTVTSPTITPSTLATCNLGSGSKQPYTCYGTSTDTTITLLFAGYNSNVARSNPPAINDYKVCSITGLPNGNVVTVTTPFTVTGSATLNEKTSVTLTLNPNGSNTITQILTALSSNAPLLANFYAESSPCP